MCEPKWKWELQEPKCEKQPFIAVALTDGYVPDWRMTYCPLTSWLRHGNALAICCICRDPQLRGEEKHTLQLQLECTCFLLTWALGMARISGLSPQWLIFPPNCLIRFPRFLQESVCLGDGRHIREGGYRVVTDFPKSSILLYWNASQMKEEGSRDLVQVCANHKSCSASFHLQFIALTFLLCWLLLGSYCKFGQLQLLFHLSLLSSVGSVTSKVAHSAEAGSVS